MKDKQERCLSRMIIYDLLMTVPLNDVLEKVSYFYGNEHTKEIGNLYTELKTLKPQKCSNILTIEINAFKEVNDKFIYVDNFDENDDNMIFDVSAYSTTDNEIYSIESADKIDFLSYIISFDTQRKYSKASILAHCLWDITSFSYNE